MFKVGTHAPERVNGANGTGSAIVDAAGGSRAAPRSATSARVRSSTSSCKPSDATKLPRGTGIASLTGQASARGRGKGGEGRRGDGRQAARDVGGLEACEAGVAVQLPQAHMSPAVQLQAAQVTKVAQGAPGQRRFREHARGRCEAGSRVEQHEVRAAAGLQCAHG